MSSHTEANKTSVSDEMKNSQADTLNETATVYLFKENGEKSEKMFSLKLVNVFYNSPNAPMNARA